MCMNWAAFALRAVVIIVVLVFLGFVLWRSLRHSAAAAGGLGRAPLRRGGGAAQHRGASPPTVTGGMPEDITDPTGAVSNVVLTPYFAPSNKGAVAAWDRIRAQFAATWKAMDDLLKSAGKPRGYDKLNIHSGLGKLLRGEANPLRLTRLKLGEIIEYYKTPNLDNLAKFNTKMGELQNTVQLITEALRKELPADHPTVDRFHRDHVKPLADLIASIPHPVTWGDLPAYVPFDTSRLPAEIRANADNFVTALLQLRNEWAKIRTQSIDGGSMARADELLNAIESSTRLLATHALVPMTATEAAAIDAWRIDALGNLRLLREAIGRSSKKSIPATLDTAHAGALKAVAKLHFVPSIPHTGMDAIAAGSAIKGTYDGVKNWYADFRLSRDYATITDHSIVTVIDPLFVAYGNLLSTIALVTPPLIAGDADNYYRATTINYKAAVEAFWTSIVGWRTLAAPVKAIHDASTKVVFPDPALSAAPMPPPSISAFDRTRYTALNSDAVVDGLAKLAKAIAGYSKSAVAKRVIKAKASILVNFDRDNVELYDATEAFLALYANPASTRAQWDAVRKRFSDAATAVGFVTRIKLQVIEDLPPYTDPLYLARFGDFKPDNELLEEQYDDEYVTVILVPIQQLVAQLIQEYGGFRKKIFSSLGNDIVAMGKLDRATNSFIDSSIRVLNAHTIAYTDDDAQMTNLATEFRTQSDNAAKLVYELDDTTLDAASKKRYNELFESIGKTVTHDYIDRYLESTRSRPAAVVQPPARPIAIAQPVHPATMVLADPVAVLSRPPAGDGIYVLVVKSQQELERLIATRRGLFAGKKVYAIVSAKPTDSVVRQAMAALKLKPTEETSFGPGESEAHVFEVMSASGSTQFVTHVTSK